MAAQKPDAPGIRRRAVVGLSVSLGLIVVLVLPMLAGWAGTLGWARSRYGVLLVPAAYFAIELLFGRSIPELARRWDELPRWQQALCGVLVVAVVGAVFVSLLIAAAE